MAACPSWSWTRATTRLLQPGWATYEPTEPTHVSHLAQLSGCAATAKARLQQRTSTTLVKVVPPAAAGGFTFQPCRSFSTHFSAAGNDERKHPSAAREPDIPPRSRPRMAWPAAWPAALRRQDTRRQQQTRVRAAPLARGRGHGAGGQRRGGHVGAGQTPARGHSWSRWRGAED